MDSGAQILVGALGGALIFASWEILSISRSNSNKNDRRYGVLTAAGFFVMGIGAIIFGIIMAN